MTTVEMPSHGRHGGQEVPGHDHHTESGPDQVTRETPDLRWNFYRVEPAGTS